jgi:hypothetical protein
LLRLEDFDYAHYRELCNFFFFFFTVDAERFGALAGSRPNAGPNPPLALDGWPERGISEFEAEVAPLARTLGYEHRIASLCAGASALASPSVDVAEVLSALGRAPSP